MSNQYQSNYDEISSPIEEEEYANLFGRKFTIQNLTGGLIKGCFPSCPQVFNHRNQQEVQKKFGAGIPKGASCREIDVEIDRIQNEMNMIRGKITGGQKGKYWTSALGTLEARIADARNRRTNARCTEIQQEQEREREKQSQISALDRAVQQATTTDPLAAVQSQIQEQKSAAPDYTKFIAIGIAGVFIIGAVILLLKPAKAPVPAA